MKWKSLGIEVFAIVASYLVITISVAGAATIRTYDSTGTQVGGQITYDSESLVKREISVDPGTMEMRFLVENGSASVNIDKVWLFRCKDKTPHECIDSIFFVPDSFSSGADISYSWADISAGSPERANLFYIIKLSREGRTSWLGFWTSVEKQLDDSFVVSESEISDIGVYAKSVDIISTIRQFIENYGMIPANPGWVNKVVFEGASSFYEIGLSGEASLESPSRPVSQDISGDEATSVSWDYSIMLPVSSVVMNAMTLQLNPSYTCGMFGCESDMGESSASCCLDCGCSPGYYCDVSRGCMQEDGITLSLYGSVNPRVSNCNEAHVVNIPVTIDSAPSSYSVTEMWCRLDGSYSSCSCTGGSGDVFVCSVNVPPVPGCDSGEFVVSNNAIRLKIEYMDGAVQKSRYVETVFPDITVGSFTCGDFGCEADLGESWENCCYDCGCTNGYCNYEWGADPSSGECKNDPSVSDLYAVRAAPTHFYDHSPNDGVVFDIILENKPVTLSVEGVEGEMGCSDGVGECESSCTIEWSEMGSSDPDVYNMSVMARFSISDYDPLKDYVLSPLLTFNLRYRNGTGQYIDRVLAKTFNQVSIGAHWCGDQHCGEDEGYGTCCYDCYNSCPSGQYCYTQNINGPTEGDGCRAASFSMVLKSMGSLELQDSSVEHNIPIQMHVNNYPAGISLVPECELAGGGVPCTVACTPVSSDNPASYNLSCTMTVPAMDYVSSLYYNPSTRLITLAQNSLNMSMYYNNGFSRGTSTMLHTPGDVVINVTSHCGEGSGDPFMMCEAWLGEDQSNCCRDCGCGSFGEESFCYVGASPNGECVDNSTIDLRISGTEPDPWECIIGKIGGDCIYIRTHVISANVINSPSDLVMTETFYSIDGGNTTHLSCIKTAGFGDWDCALIPDRMDGGNGTVNGTVELFATATYTMNNSPIVLDFSAILNFTTQRTKSDALITCEEEIERLREQITRLQTNQDGYNSQGMMYIIMGTVMIGIGILLMVKCCGVEGCNAICAMGALMIAMGLMQLYLGITSDNTGTNLDTQIQQLEELIEQKREICSSEEFEQAATAAYGINPVSEVVYG